MLEETVKVRQNTTPSCYVRWIHCRVVMHHTTAERIILIVSQPDGLIPTLCFNINNGKSPAEPSNQH